GVALGSPTGSPTNQTPQGRPVVAARALAMARYELSWREPSRSFDSSRDCLSRGSVAMTRRSMMAMTISISRRVNPHRDFLCRRRLRDWRAMLSRLQIVVGDVIGVVESAVTVRVRWLANQKWLRMIRVIGRRG